MKQENIDQIEKNLSLLPKEELKQHNVYLRNIALGKVYGPMTGYASLDKPWLKYYNENNIELERENCTAYCFMRKHNINNLESISINYMNNSLTYKDMLNKIDEVTKSLVKLNIKKGDIVTLITANIPENIYLFYALNRIGAVAIMADPRLKEEELTEIITSTNSKNVFAIDTFMNKKVVDTIKTHTNVNNIVLISPLESLKKNKLMKKTFDYKSNKIKKETNAMLWNEFLDMGYNVRFNEENLDENLPALMVRTGGTTGKPKTVILSNKNLNEMALQHSLGEYNFNKKDKFLNFLPPFIAYGLCCATHMPLVLGLEVILIPKFSAKIFPKLLRKYNPNVVFAGPILYEKLMNNRKTKNYDLSSLKIPVSGGDTMNKNLEIEINDYFKRNNCNHKIGQGYGMTEVSSSACYSKENSYTLGSVGIPLINNVIAIFDPTTLEEKLFGEEGEICIKTDTSMIGYLNNDEETNKVIKTHGDGSKWIHTGDIGKMNSNGNLFVVGRMKRIIVSNGSKIFPSSIEEIITKNKDVESCVVVGKPDKKYRSVPVAHIVLKNDKVDKDKLIIELESAIKKQLPDFYLPYEYIFRKNMPLTSIDKIDYVSLENEESKNKDNIKVKRLIKNKKE